MDYIELLPCPICGAHPDRTKESLAKSGGHGYPGSCSYQYKCEKCGYLKGDSTTDVYDHFTVADARARISWNKEVQRVLHFMETKQKGEELK